MDDHEPRSLGNQNIITYCSILYMAACANTHIQTCMHTYRHTYIHIHTHTPLHCITLHCITLHYITLHYITYTHTHTGIQTDIHTITDIRTSTQHARIHTCVQAYIRPSTHPTIHDPSMIRPWSVHDPSIQWDPQAVWGKVEGPKIISGCKLVGQERP